MNDYEAAYKDLYAKYITRKGASELLQWLDGTDFFTAPASTRNHECYEGGLAQHSVEVFWQLVKLIGVYKDKLVVTHESAAIIGLLHDVCKANCYKTEMRNKKDESGKWIQVPHYTFNEDFVYGGHGSKSVYLIQNYMILTDEEAIAINCHMGVENGKWEINDAFRAHPLAFITHTADMAATISGLHIQI